uniref:C2 domain-containing protein n=1 Tax=Triticum urartu TaxID=4572 RepID=A0A8R7TQE7_TRIUA
MLSLEMLANRRSQVYYSPKLICLNVTVIAAQDLIGTEIARPLAPTIVKIQMGSQIRRTRPGQPQGSANQAWNEDLLFVASESSKDPLVVTVEEKVAAGRDEPIGRIICPVASPYVTRSKGAKLVPSKWFRLSRSRRTMSMPFASKIHLRMSLETAYHVPEESKHYSSDLQPAAEKLRRSAIGVLEVGILGAHALGDNKHPYCVAKYGDKWMRTRTLLGTVAQQWNEPYTWDVFDPNTVVTIAVLNNNHLFGHGDGSAMDQRIGKVRIWLATLQSDRVYTHYYPLMALSPRGLKKTGELHLATRFTCTAWANMLAQYWGPPLPTMHYTNPISELQLDYLRVQAMVIVARGWAGRIRRCLGRRWSTCST